MLEALQPRLHFHLSRARGFSRPRVVFLHIPKCAGTSINYHFKANFGGKRSGRTVMLDSVQANICDPAVLARAKEALFVCGHFGWSALERVRGDAVAFTIVREPFERLKALYAFACKRRRITNPAFARLAEVALQMSFEDFCLSDDPLVCAFVDNAQTRTLAHDYFPVIHKSTDIAVAKTHMETLDFIADSSDLSRVLPRIAAATGTVPVTGRDWQNKTGTGAAVEITRADFLRERQLFARISKDLEVYEHARRLAW